MTSPARHPARVPAVPGLVALTLLGAALLGCDAGDPGPTGHPVAVGRPIYHGTPDVAPAHGAVVALTYGPGTGAFCSGTLITPAVVATAAHCLWEQDPTAMQVFFGSDVESGGEFRDVSEGRLHPDFDPDGLDGDLGLLRLASAAPASVTPIPALPSTMPLTEAEVGAGVVFSGFGVTEEGTSGLKLTVSGTIGLVCTGPLQCTFGGAPVGPACFAYAQGSGGPCSGDSGGPAFIQRIGNEYLAGVTSYGDELCSHYGVSTMVSAYEYWIAQFVGTVGVEDCSQAGDEDGDGLADCADPDCAETPACLEPTACTLAPAIACGGVASGTTVGGAARFSTYACLSQGSEAGPERAYRLDVAAGLTVTANLQLTSSGDLDLFVLPTSGADCLPAGCLEASLNSGAVAEQVSLVMPAGGAYLVIDTWDTPGSFSLEVTCSGVPAEVCDNGVDDDGDELADCEDPDCADAPACAPPVEACDNGVDDDGDELADCEDPDCADAPACAPGDGVVGGCGCAAPARGGAGGAPLLLGLCGWLLTRRRRRFTIPE
jgi:hypothetical protein